MDRATEGGSTPPRSVCDPLDGGEGAAAKVKSCDMRDTDRAPVVRQQRVCVCLCVLKFNTEPNGGIFDVSPDRASPNVKPLSLGLFETEGKNNGSLVKILLTFPDIFECTRYLMERKRNNT